MWNVFSRGIASDGRNQNITDPLYNQHPIANSCQQSQMGGPIPEMLDVSVARKMGQRNTYTDNIKKKIKKAWKPHKLQSLI